MKKASRLVIFFVLLALLSTAIVSCGDTNNEKSDDIVATSSTTSSTELFGNLPNVKYQDAEITILVEGDYTDLYKSEEIVPNESSFSLISDAVATRNALVEEKFGVKIKEVRTTRYGEMQQLLTNNQTSGLDLYDIVTPYIPLAAALSLQNYFYLMNDNENLHLDEKYWDQGAIKGLSINNKNYFATGDFSLLSLGCTHAIVFNKDLIKENNLENPYDLVKDGKWTIDKLNEMARKVTSDSDGVTGMSYKDTYGFLINENFATSMFVGSGERITGKNSEDLPSIAVYSDRGVSVFEKIFKLVNDKQATGHIDSQLFISQTKADSKTVWEAATESVANKKALFRAMAIVDIPELGDYECNFGILPIPKYDEEQTEYYSLVSAVAVSCAAIPVTNSEKDFNRNAIILDAICQASTDTVKYNYYQVMLKSRKIQDLESEQMLDEIFNNRVYDLGMIFGWGGAGIGDPDSISYFMNTIVFSGTNTFASKYESIKSKIQTSLDNTIEKFQTD